MSKPKSPKKKVARVKVDDLKSEPVTNHDLETVRGGKAAAPSPIPIPYPNLTTKRS